MLYFPLDVSKIAQFIRSFFSFRADRLLSEFRLSYSIRAPFWSGLTNGISGIMAVLA
jgi:hypothetical protein